MIKMIKLFISFTVFAIAGLVASSFTELSVNDPNALQVVDFFINEFNKDWSDHNYYKQINLKTISADHSGNYKFELELGKTNCIKKMGLNLDDIKKCPLDSNKAVSKECKVEVNYRPWVGNMDYFQITSKSCVDKAVKSESKKKTPKVSNSFSMLDYAIMKINSQSTYDNDFYYKVEQSEKPVNLSQTNYRLYFTIAKTSCLKDKLHLSIDEINECSLSDDAEVKKCLVEIYYAQQVANQYPYEILKQICL